MDKQLHIVCHTIPWPADFGGVQDIFHSIVALQNKNVKIHLHCFTKDMQASTGPLKDYCENIYLYKRTTGLLKASAKLPYIVNTRKSKALLRRLNEDNFPILIQGIHSSYALKDLDTSDRKIAIRLFNVETKYYKSLALLETNILKKTYYNSEARLLKKYEADIAKKKYTMLCISDSDCQYYKVVFDAVDAKFLPAFTGHFNIKTKEGKGEYLLYQANLSVNENSAIAIWLVQKIAAQISIPVIIAGKNPTDNLKSTAKNKTNVQLIANPSEEKMLDLIANAHILIVPSYNNTGVKLKLLNALYNGRHCVSNEAGIAGSGLDSLVNIAEDDESTITLIEELIQQTFTEEEIKKRATKLFKIYDDSKNAQSICDLLL